MKKNGSGTTGGWKRFITPERRDRLHKILRDVVALFSSVRDPRVPWTAKATALASVVYLLLPVDFIPDFIPVLGLADDIAVVPLACFLASKMVPPGVMDRLRDDAEFRLMRWGPTAKRALLIFLAGWILLAGIGGCMMLRDRHRPEATPKQDWEQRMIQELHNARQPESTAGQAEPTTKQQTD